MPSGELLAVGIASFGPVDLDQLANLWLHHHYPASLEPGGFAGNPAGVGLPVAFDTDVNLAALVKTTGRRVTAADLFTI
jgi:predicted NBD/HSP70 family sugar kinase